MVLVNLNKCRSFQPYQMTIMDSMVLLLFVFLKMVNPSTLRTADDSIAVYRILADSQLLEIVPTHDITYVI